MNQNAIKVQISQFAFPYSDCMFKSNFQLFLFLVFFSFFFVVLRSILHFLSLSLELCVTRLSKCLLLIVTAFDLIQCKFCMLENVQLIAYNNKMLIYVFCIEFMHRCVSITIFCFAFLSHFLQIMFLLH